MNELSEDELRLFRSLNSKKARATKQYKSNLKNSMQSLLNMEVATIDGTMIQLSDKVALSAIESFINKPDVDKYIGLMKATGEYSEKAEVSVNNLEEIMSKLKGDDF